MSEYSGNIRDLPVVTGGHFIENSTKKIVFGPDGRFWNDYVMRLFTLEPEAESSVHSHPSASRGRVISSSTRNGCPWSSAPGSMCPAACATTSAIPARGS